MSAHVTIGIDNGTTGSIAILGPDSAIFETMPTMRVNEGREGKMITRIDHKELAALLRLHIPVMARAHAYVEKSFTGSAMMINTSLLAARSYEAVIIVLEQLGIGYHRIASSDWQKPVLGAVKGRENLKAASLSRGVQYYPQLAAAIKAHGDADGLLIAHHYHHNPA